MQEKQKLITFTSKLVIGLKIDHWTQNWSSNSKLITGLEMVSGCWAQHWMRKWSLDVKIVIGRKFCTISIFLQNCLS